MSYLLNTNLSLQALNADNSINNTFKSSVSAVELGSTLSYSIQLQAGVATEVGLPLLSSLQVVGAKSLLPIDISFQSVNDIDVYTGSPSTTLLFMNPAGFNFSHIKILSAVSVLVEVFVGGKF